MSELRTHQFSEEDSQEVMDFARDALETYVREGQQMDVGSVSDLLNMRGGLLLQIESATGMNRVRGSGAIYNGQRIADSTIQATVYAASSRSIGSEVSYNETTSVVFKIALIEDVIVTDEPENEIEVGRDVPVIVGVDNGGWMFPTQSEEYNWTPEEYLTRTCKKSGVKPDYWEDNQMIVIRTRPFRESEPEERVVMN